MALMNNKTKQKKNKGRAAGWCQMPTLSHVDSRTQNKTGSQGKSGHNLQGGRAGGDPRKIILIHPWKS